MSKTNLKYITLFIQNKINESQLRESLSKTI